MSVIYSNEELEHIYTRIINILYSILGSYENCMQTKDFKPFITQCRRVATQMIGFKSALDSVVFIEINGILLGMIEDDMLTQPIVKTLIFYCIDLVNKLKRR